MFILKTLELKNFRSYKDLLIDDIDTLGLTLINGKNGSGKSSLKMAIEYLLTDNVGELSVEDLSFNKRGNCKLSCLFINDDNSDLIKITKYRDHKKYKNSIILEVNGDSESFTENDRRQTQKNIEKLFKINKEDMSISSIFSQESLSFPKCKESDRKKILYDALSLNKYTEKHNKAKDKIKVVQKGIDDLELKKGYIGRSIEECEEKIEKLELKSKEWERNRAQDIENYNSEIETIINRKIYDLDELKKEKEGIKSLLKGYKEEINEKEKRKIEINEEEKESLVQDYEFLKKRKIQIEFELQRSKKELDKLGDGICPVLREKCPKLLEKEEEIKDDTNKNIEHIKTEYKSVLKKWDTVDRLLDECRVNDKINEDLNKEIEHLENYISVRKRELQHKEELISKALSEEEDKKDRINKIKEAIEKKKAEEDPYISMIVDEDKLIKDKNSELLEASKDLSELYEDIKYWEFLKIAYSKSGIPNMRMEGFLESLEIETNKILSLISDKLYVTIDSQGLTKSGQVREKINYEVHHPDKEITNFWSYSGGQRQRINLASMFAFNELLGRFNFVILDEVLELSLDGSGKEDIIKLLKGKVKDIGTILCISHDNSIKDSFNNIIDVKMKDEISYMEV